ncbi:peroxisomal biogenesis factor 19 isoform X2 [Pararge aegeria]|uniref:peroxisomal biogenesis factor 19 isoform X2 n=1 Tax=Pararge aegeria TaxID=116150 RepID=UPI0019D2D94F|nr:peroxisomal biogenesis factor 19 isoform X2 [Pararge aegeria]
MSENKDVARNDADPELDDLLDSALLDMTKRPEQVATPENVHHNIWSEEFIKEAAAQFESNMASILGGFSGVPEAAAQVLKPPSDDAATEPEANDPAVQEKIDEVSAAISQTLQNLNTNAENLQTPFSDADLANMFNNFNLGEGGNQEGNMFLPFMQGMMQSLLSKEVLYPSLKELVEKYPTWLAENKGKIEQSELERFEKQQSLMQQVCSELEPEQDTDNEDVKRKRFETVLKLMQQMQDLGQPPTELVGDISAAPEGFVAPTGQDASQCTVM